MTDLMTDREIRNPWNHDLIASLSWTTEAEAEEALTAVYAGRSAQKARTAAERAGILGKLAQLLERDRDILATMIVNEIGKTIQDAQVEIDRAGATTQCAAEEARRLSGELLDSDAWGAARGKMGLVTWQPVGVVLAICPFNFPVNIAMHKIAPAWAAGNTVLFKPHPQNEPSGRHLLALCYEAGMSRDEIRLISPDIPVMQKLIADRRVAFINFTGGTTGGKAIAATAAGKPMILELGGNDPLIVMPDGNLDQAVTAAINQRFATAGQRCTAAKRLYIHADVYEAFKAKLLAITAQLRVGDPALSETDVGPVFWGGADRVYGAIQGAMAAGATLLAGGERDGNLIQPTILENVPDQDPLVCEETFGPVIPLRKFEDIEEVIALVNASDFGLQGGVFTNNLAVAKELFDRLEVGTLAVNDGPGFRAEHFPFGGVKDSGLGREGVPYAMREMSYRKTLVL